MLGAALLCAVFVVMYFHANDGNGPALMNGAMTFTGLSLIAAVWCGYVGVKNSSARYQKTSWFGKLVFVHTILGTISGLSWFMISGANSDIGFLLVILGFLITLGILWGALVLPIGLIGCFLFRGYYFLYFLTQLVLIGIGFYILRLIIAVAEAC